MAHSQLHDVGSTARDWERLLYFMNITTLARKVVRPKTGPAAPVPPPLQGVRGLRIELIFACFTFSSRDPAEHLRGFSNKVRSKIAVPLRRILVSLKSRFGPAAASGWRDFEDGSAGEKKRKGLYGLQTMPNATAAVLK